MKKAKKQGGQPALPTLPGMAFPPNEGPVSAFVKTAVAKNAAPTDPDRPENLGKTPRLPVPDFSDPQRKLTCLEVDFPIAQINALSDLEGNAGKPIYQMSKWWARRRSSVFRSMLIAAATRAPDDPTEAAKLVWNHYYCNHQKAGTFKKLKVLDCFMGGGTTLVEGSRLGMRMTGNDLNPVAWFVVKNELACSAPEQVKALFAEVENQVKPQIQPFYTTTCPRGHKGRWIDERTGKETTLDPIDLSPEERSHYRWVGPEVIYTFWVKHGPCQAKGCGHRTPLFNLPRIAEKSLSTQYLEMHCPHCGVSFHADLGETRMAPSAERIVLADEHFFTELSQPVARLFKDYDKGNDKDTLARIEDLLKLLPDDNGLTCPQCGKFAGQRLLDIVHLQYTAKRAGERKKKAYAIKNKAVQMHLLLHSDWLKGTPCCDKKEQQLSGLPGATLESTAKWYMRRGENMRLVEVRGVPLPELILLSDGSEIHTKKGTVPRDAHFTCASCGRENNTLESIKHTENIAPHAVYALQCHCPQCENENYTYGGRYFTAPDIYDVRRLITSNKEWCERKNRDLYGYWPTQKIDYSHMTHERNPLPDHGYRFWHDFFNSRQLLVHTLLLKALMDMPEDSCSLDVREQVLGAFQQYLRNQNMFAFWNIGADKMEPMFSNPNYNPKAFVIENGVFSKLGRGNWQSASAQCVEGLEWVKKPWELRRGADEKAKSEKEYTEDPVIPGAFPYCGSSTDLSMLEQERFDLVITDPPFGNNLYYADLADFFYVWLRIPLSNWYAGLPEAAYFEPERTPRSLEAIDNPAEHPDDRVDYEKSPFIQSRHLAVIHQASDNHELQEKDPNPLYRPEPSSDFYCRTLSACWAEAGRLLKDGGIMAFTFHHNEDQAWVDVLKALFDSGYVLVATYPIRSDESKGENASFGSKKIEYDIIHVCRKRLHEPEPVSWSRMRRWVKEEAERLKELLEHTHGQSLPEPDLRVILRGKSLEFYSRHYGKVFTGDGQLLEVRDALLGINQLLDDILESTVSDGADGVAGELRPPDSAEPASRLFLSIFRKRSELARDALHKRLRGTGVSQSDLEAKGWLRTVGRQVYAVPVKERFAFYMEPGRNRKVIKTDLDQAYFCIGAALTGLNLNAELDNPNFRVKKSVDDLLIWLATTDEDAAIRRAAQIAAELLARWRVKQAEKKPEERQISLFEHLEATDG